MSFYPPNINKRFLALSNIGEPAQANASGKSASFVCGSFVRISLWIDEESLTIETVKFQTNGCGFMMAAADVLCDSIKNKSLKELHGLVSKDLNSSILNELEQFPDGRGHCREKVFEALRIALSDFRSRLIAEFHGEKALICTCFGISEETVEKCIIENSAESVDEVTDLCRAGGGCGSCHFLIREMIDSFQSETR